MSANYVLVLRMTRAATAECHYFAQRDMASRGPGQVSECMNRYICESDATEAPIAIMAYDYVVQIIAM
jgi:hypothetical protein